jgi:hypothetical protein
MTKALVINKGDLGSNLLNSYKFDHLFTSENFHLAREQSFTELLFAALPDCKERANKYSQEDNDIIENMKDILRTIKIDRIIVISTIDVYNDTDRELDEDYDCDWFINHPYGNHRYMFEYFIKKTFENHHIIRLPYIFDKINILNILSFNTNISIDSMLQFYDIKWLNDDIDVIIHNNIKLCNFVTNHIRLKNILDMFNIDYLPSLTVTQKLYYNIKTKHFSLFESKIKGFIRDQPNLTRIYNSIQ